MKTKSIVAAFAAIVASGMVAASSAGPDWLLDPSPYKAQITERADGWVLSNGLVSRTIVVSPGAATVSFRCESTGEEFVRAVSPEARLTVDGEKLEVGGMGNQPVHNYLRREWISKLQPAKGAYVFKGATTGAIEPRFEWKRLSQWTARKSCWPAKGLRIDMRYAPPEGRGADAPEVGRRLPSVTVHYEIYNGLPVVCKWFTLTNDTGRAVRLDSFVSEELRLAEASGQFDREWHDTPRNIQAQSNYGYNAMGWRGPAAEAVRFEQDKTYMTQEHWGRDGIHMLRCSPTMGPAETVAPGGVFESCRLWELLLDSSDRERRGLAFRRMHRIISPWTNENPLMFHCKAGATVDNVKAAIKQCVDTGFEVVIMSFGSGFNLESTKPAYRATYKALADEARAAGIGLGGYSLTSSRSAGDRADNVHNPNPCFRVGPCLVSRWGRAYHEAISSFMKEAGFSIFENDGPYPGDWCQATNHLYHSCKEDSVWKQWRAQSDLYRFCRANGIYVNQPDGYFLEGGNKTGGGYRESNWSLPREYQMIIERQNVYDNSWTWNTSMHWMFVPLAQYHGGGGAATVEPLKNNLAHYSGRFANLLGAGIQACWRGPRLYDSPETLEMVRKWVSLYKKHRNVFDGDMIHLRRADGRDWDGWLMIDPDPGEGVRAIASLFNPLHEPIRRRIELPLYYARRSGTAQIAVGDGAEYVTVALDHACKAEIEVEIPADGNLRVYVK